MFSFRGEKSKYAPVYILLVHWPWRIFVCNSHIHNSKYIFIQMVKNPYTGIRILIWNVPLRRIIYECLRMNQIQMDISSLDTAWNWWHYFWTAPCHHFSANPLPSGLAENQIVWSTPLSSLSITSIWGWSCSLSNT